MRRRSDGIVILLALAACASPATAPKTSSSATPNGPPPPNIAGEWIDTTFRETREWVDIWHVTQQDTTVTIVDSLWSLGQGIDPVWAAAPCTPATCDYGGTLHADTLVLSGQQAITQLATGIFAGGVLTMTDARGDTDVYVRGTWSPPSGANVVAPSDTLLHGIWVSDSIAWEISDPSCVGIIQYGLVLPPPFDSDSSIYQGYVYARLCGSTQWTQWTQNLGEEVDSVLTFGQIQPVPGTGIFASWWLKAMATDTLANLTPADSVHGAWMPAHFYRVDSLPGGVDMTARLRPAFSRADSTRALRPHRATPVPLKTNAMPGSVHPTTEGLR